MKENLFSEYRKKFCPFSSKNSPKIDYKDIRLLSRYVSEKGKMVPSLELTLKIADFFNVDIDHFVTVRQFGRSSFKR